jgi:hypothetical protein
MWPVIYFGELGIEWTVFFSALQGIIYYLRIGKFEILCLDSAIFKGYYQNESIFSLYCAFYCFDSTMYIVNLMFDNLQMELIDDNLFALVITESSLSFWALTNYMNSVK